MSKTEYDEYARSILHEPPSIHFAEYSGSLQRNQSQFKKRSFCKQFHTRHTNITQPRDTLVFFHMLTQDKQLKHKDVME